MNTTNTVNLQQMLNEESAAAVINFLQNNARCLKKKELPDDGSGYTGYISMYIYDDTYYVTVDGDSNSVTPYKDLNDAQQAYNSLIKTM